MSALDFLSDAFDTSLDLLSGGETVTIDSKPIPCIADPVSEGEDLVPGGPGDHRSLSLLVQSSALPSPPPRPGNHVQYREQDWTIAALDFHPRTTTRLTLHSPARREF